MGTTPRGISERHWEIDFADFGFGSEDGLAAWSPPSPAREAKRLPRRERAEPAPSVRIAHVLASTEGIEDVEVSVVCPECQTKVLLDIAHEPALETAFSWLARQQEEAGKPAALQDEARDGAPPENAEAGPPDSTWRARSVAIREELSMLLMSLPVSDVMNETTHSVRASARISTVSVLISGDDLPGLIVLDDDDRPVGMITPAQLVRVVFSVSRERLEGLHVSNVMLSRMFCVRMDAPLARAMELFNEQGASKIAVVGEDGKLVGSLSPAELVAFLGQA